MGPRFAFLENVPGLVRTDYFGKILGDLAEAGLDAEWTIVSAGECGAPHRRERLWILADAECNGCNEISFKRDARRMGKTKGEEEGRESEAGRLTTRVEYGSEIMANAGCLRQNGIQSKPESGSCSKADSCTGGEDMADPDMSRRQDAEGCGAPTSEEWDETAGVRGWWDTEPRLGRVADGVAHRMDRLKAIGNGQVPAVVVEAWERMTRSVT
jgi:DNA (cytosine-5)-methyltransferase 1